MRLLKCQPICEPSPNMSLALLAESYELYTNQFGLDANGYYLSPPPDCMDLFYGIDATRRILSWLDEYGNRLPPEIRNAIFDAANWVLTNPGSIFYPMSKPTTPQIPFNP